MPYTYASQCSNKDGMPGNHLAEGKLISLEGRVVTHQCRACAQEIIDEYREKMGWEWSFEPYATNKNPQGDDISRSVVTSEEIPKSECDRAHWRRMLKRQLKGLGYNLTEYVNSIEWLQTEIIKLGAKPFKPCFVRKGLGSVCMLPADGHTEHKYQQFGQQKQEIETEEINLRYPEENTIRETPLRVGTKRIKINGIEFPFVAVVDAWVPTLLHENRLVWIRHVRAIEGLRKRVFKVYYATGKVPYNRLPWTVDNENDGKEYRTLIEAINAALLIAHEKEIELEKSNAASLLGRAGGLVKSEVKARKSKENGIKGGRKRSFSALDMESEEENTK